MINSTPMPSATAEDYLKAIYELSAQVASGHELTQLGDIAKHLKLTPGTVTTMLKNLASKNLVEYFPRKGVKLTEKGLRVAIRTLRNHKLVEQFLIKVLNYSWDEVHDEAEKLEHVVSAKFVNRLEKLLDYPKFDHCGKPIPSLDDNDTINDGFVIVPLADVGLGDRIEIIEAFESSSLLKWLSDNKINLGNRYTIASKDQTSQIIIIQAGRRKIPISLTIARKIGVRIASENFP